MKTIDFQKQLGLTDEFRKETNKIKSLAIQMRLASVSMINRDDALIETLIYLGNEAAKIINPVLVTRNIRPTAPVWLFMVSSIEKHFEVFCSDESAQAKSIHWSGLLAKCAESFGELS